MPNIIHFENPKTIPRAYWLFTFKLIQNSKVLIIKETKNSITVKDVEVLCRGECF